jgi:hypothetical protein
MTGGGEVRWNRVVARTFASIWPLCPWPSTRSNRILADVRPREGGAK